MYFINYFHDVKVIAYLIVPACVALLLLVDADEFLLFNIFPDLILDLVL